VFVRHPAQAAVLGGVLGGYIRRRGRRRERGGNFMPIRRKTCLDELMGEVFEFAVQDFIGFVNGGLGIPGSVG
jgi:hypothetical protein